jgi:hypothetical protein
VHPTGRALPGRAGHRPPAAADCISRGGASLLKPSDPFPTHELVPQAIKDAAAKKGYDLVEVYARLGDRLNADMIRTYMAQ